MKLHLPGKLRTALLACYAVSASLVTTISSGSFVGGALVTTAAAVLASQQAYAKNITFDGGIISDFKYGSLIPTPTAGDVSFSKDDNLAFIKDTSLSMGGNVTAGIFAVGKDVVLDLSSNGYKLDAAFEIREGVLRLSNDVLDDKAKVSRSNTGRVEIAWGEAGGSLVSQLENFTGLLDVNNSVYDLSIGENRYTKLVLHGEEAKLTTKTSNYTLPIVSVGDTSLDTLTNNTVLTGMLSGFGTLTKEGLGVLTFKSHDVFYYGDLVVNEGTVRWGGESDTDNPDAARNKYSFASITINNGAVFDDSHSGCNMSGTDIILNGGTLRAFSMEEFAGAALRNLTCNTYGKLLVQGSGTIDAEQTAGRRFGVLSSLNSDAATDGDAPSETTLTIDNGTQLTYTIIDAIENFHGTITGSVEMNDAHKLYISAVNQAAGYEATVNAAVNAFGFVKDGEGEFVFGNSLKALDTVLLNKGSLAVTGTLDAENLTVHGGSMTVGQNVSLQTLRIFGGELTVQNPVTIKVQDAVEIFGGKFTVSSDSSKFVVMGDLTVSGGKTLVKGQLTGTEDTFYAYGDLQFTGDVDTEFVVNGDVVLDSLSKTGSGKLHLGAYADSSLTVRKNLLMNYGGEAASFNNGDFSNIKLGDDVVLSYQSGVANVIKFKYERDAFDAADYLFADVFGVSAEDLAKGINLGIESGGTDTRMEHFYASTLGKKGVDYVVEIGADNYYYLRTLNGQSAKTSWDINWGKVEVSSAPETVEPWVFTSIDDTGLYGNSSFDDGHFIAAELKGTNPTGAPGTGTVNPGTGTEKQPGVAVYGGAYDSVDTEGATIERDIWLKATGGNFAMIVGGSRCDSGKANAGWSLKGDTHIYVSEGVESIGSIVGGNYGSAFDPNWTGDGYISVHTSGLSGSIIGGGFTSVSHIGDSNIFIYKSLSKNISSPDTDFTIGDTVGGNTMLLNPNSIVAGLCAVKPAQWRGDGVITVDLRGDSSINRMAKSIVGGSFVQLTGNTDSIRHYGNNRVTIKNTCEGRLRNFTNHIVGADYVIGAGVAEMHGDTYVVLSNLGDATQIGPDSNYFVTGGHLALSVGGSYSTGNRHAIYGNTRVEISDAGQSSFSANVVAGNASTREISWDLKELSASSQYERAYDGLIDGDTSLVIDSGVYKGMVVGGHYYEDFIHDAMPDNPGQVPVHPAQGSEPDILTVTGTTHLKLSGGSFNNAVIGASYYDGWDKVTLYTGSVEINTKGATFGGRSNKNGLSIVGGYYIDEFVHGNDVDQPYGAANGGGGETAATIGDISITFADNVIDGIVLGGSYILRSQSTGKVRQGNILLDLRSGEFNGNIYAAGWESPYSTVSLTTDSTTVKLSADVKFGSKVTVSGGYGGSGVSDVRGNKTLEFTDATRYDNIANTNFIFFDTVKVTEKNGYVVLPHNTTLLGDYITKRGAGTLELGVQNKLDMLTVAEGTLKLAANSGGTASGTMIEQLNLAKGATLDLSAGNCGINGDLVVEGGSVIKIGTGLAPTAIERLIWDDSEKVMLTLSALPTGAESYVVELFSGLTKADVVGLNMRTLDVGYGVRASNYINSNVDLTNSYILLEGDKLVLCRAPRRGIYWEYNGGDGPGYWLADNAWGKKDETAPDTAFSNIPGEDNVVFSNGNATIIVNSEVMPYDIYVKNGVYTFDGEGKEAVITPYGSIVLSDGATAVFTQDVLLNTNPDTTVIAVQDETSSLTVNNDISINKLYSKGSVTVNGNLDVATAVEDGGTLNVSGDLTVGGNSAFDELNVTGSVKNNTNYELTAGGESSIGAIDGGVVRVLKGATLDIGNGVTATTRQISAANSAFSGLDIGNGVTATTRLKALQGSGDLTTDNALEIQTDSQIGNLSADSLELGGTLQASGNVTVDNEMAVSDSVTISGNLKAQTITYDALVLKSGYAMIDVEDNVYAYDDNSPLRMNVNTAMIATKILSDGKEYYLLQCDEGGVKSDIVFNDEQLPELRASNDRYEYSAYKVNDGVVLKAKLINKNLFEDKVAETPNGITGAKLLDELYTDASILEQYPDGDLALTMEAINQQLMINNSKEGLDELFAAVAGASIPAMGVAFADDINRQMQTIRNRTTTMGVDQCAVNEDMPYFNAWINAEGGNRNLDEDGTSSGYELSSWGGTVGFDVDFSPRLTAGIAVSAMYGDYTANAPDDAEGDFDTQYVTAFARYGYRSWVHTFIASVGRADATLERTVNHQYGSYRTKGETDGMGFGLMYEVGYVRALNETGSACIQPVMNFALVKASLDGYTEEGSDAGLKVDDIEMTTFTVGAGARIQTIVGENLYNRASIFECRALAKFRAGDRNAETDVGFAAASMGTGTVESAEIGAVGIELGAGIVVPLGAEHSSVFADVSAEFSAGYTAVNGTIGYRINF